MKLKILNNNEGYFLKIFKVVTQILDTLQNLLKCFTLQLFMHTHTHTHKSTTCINITKTLLYLCVVVIETKTLTRLKNFFFIYSIVL